MVFNVASEFQEKTKKKSKPNGQTTIHLEGEFMIRFEKYIL